MENFLIIGGDAAGMSAASRARRHYPDLRVTVLEQTGDVSYSACGMPYNIADPQRPIDDLVVRNAEVFREKQGINLLTGHRAESIDRDRHVVHAAGRGRPPYERTGSGPAQQHARCGFRPMRPCLCPAVFPGMGSHAHSSQSVDQETALNYFACS